MEDYEKLTQTYYEYYKNDSRLPDLFEIIWELDPSKLIEYIHGELESDGIEYEH